MSRLKKSKNNVSLTADIVVDFALPKVKYLHKYMQGIYHRSINGMVPSNLVEELDQGVELLANTHIDLLDQYEAHLIEQQNVELERQRYYDMFFSAPLSYLITTLEGTIQEANLAAMQLLAPTENRLVGQSLSMHIAEGERRAFRTELLGLAQKQQATEMLLRFITAQSNAMPVRAMVNIARECTNTPPRLRWVLLPEA